MIDLHNHLLAGLDDGASDPVETLEMCRIAAKDGIRVIVATPHSCTGDFMTEPETVLNMVGNLNSRLKTEGLDLKVLPGMEIRVVPELPELLTFGKLMPLNLGKYLLLEFQHAHVPAGFHRLIDLLKQKGYSIVLGHPEKNLRIQEDDRYLPKLMESLGPWDLILQISADSLTGDAGKPAYKTACNLMKKGLVNVIATDAHSPKLRPPLISKALAEATRLVGEARALQMVRDIPKAILKGLGFPQPVDVASPLPWWKIFS